MFKCNGNNPNIEDGLKESIQNLKLSRFTSRTWTYSEQYGC